MYIYSCMFVHICIYIHMYMYIYRYKYMFMCVFSTYCLSPVRYPEGIAVNRKKCTSTPREVFFSDFFNQRIRKVFVLGWGIWGWRPSFGKLGGGRPLIFLRKGKEWWCCGSGPLSLWCLIFSGWGRLGGRVGSSPQHRSMHHYWSFGIIVVIIIELVNIICSQWGRWMSLASKVSTSLRRDK